jgi:voltage-gated sodium channel
LVHSHITSKPAFEIFILINIIMVGVITGLDLENQGKDEWTVHFSYVTGKFTLAVFTLECLLKIVSEGDEPWMYFTDRIDGNYNCFDFLIVLLSYVFMQSAGSAISALRILRLARLMTFVKDVPQLRIIFAGLVDVREREREREKRKKRKKKRAYILSCINCIVHTTYIIC